MTSAEGARAPQGEPAAGADVLVVGGGIAGLAATWHLARAGARVRLLEREPLLASHASGRNAAIFRHLDHDAVGVALAVRSREILRALGGPGGGLLRRTGALYLGAPEQLRPLAELAQRFGLAAEWIEGDAIGARVPVLAGGDATQGLLVPDDGVLDVHVLVEALAGGARVAGAAIRTGVEVREVLEERGRVTGVRLAGGEAVPAGAVVIAAGAWAAGLGATCGAPLPIEPRRRHLAMLADDEEAVPAAGPVVWRLDEEVYFRPEPGGVLASPCDEEPWPPGEPPAAPEALERLASRLARLAPRLAGARVRRAWACLRSFAPDRGLVGGPDPRRRGLFWVAGLGGRGMSCGAALGEVVAAAVSGRPHPLAASLSPARLMNPGGR